MTKVNGQTDALHFNVEGGIKPAKEHTDNLQQFEISVAFTDDKGQVTGNKADVIVIAPNLEVALEILESFGRQVKDLNEKQFEAFKDNHQFTFFNTCLNQTENEGS